MIVIKGIDHPYCGSVSHPVPLLDTKMYDFTVNLAVLPHSVPRGISSDAPLQSLVSIIKPRNGGKCLIISFLGLV